MSYLLTLFAGLLLAAQSPLSVNLGRKLGSPVLASLITYILGTIEFVILLLFMHVDIPQLITNAFTKGFPWSTGGLLGAIYITSIIVLFPKLGPIKAVIYPTLGQILSGILIDSFGLFKMPTSPMNLIKFFGLLLLVAGVIFSAYSPKQAQSNHPVQDRLYSAWAFIAGILSTLQSIFNANLGAKLGSPIGATFIAFLFGTVLLILVVLIMRQVTPKTLLMGVTSPLGWTTATLGAIFVLSMTILTPLLGPGLTVSITLIATMIVSAAIEHLGLLQVMKNRISRQKVIGIIIFIVGIILIKVIG
ncbi:putative membrane protein [Weissella oryzae SG25]|uniref:Putative membrane protein n=1 Tax=Weissella oryzae (strain DSM 25784 / JCM 18191 / LMG 30913 / SG25) TaxID=1329250 RepID=A0A069CUP7_WEIOS|nr:DMT family transporter [Weissella oryzae]GAK30948.1 putative membrane protein [Weissella oryzae SG25]